MQISNVSCLPNSIPGIPDPRLPLRESDSGSALEPQQQVRSSLSPIKSFYTYQKEPWLADPGYEDVASLEEYIDRKKSMDHIELALVQITYHRFQNHLESTYPDLAKKGFGFTLGPDANLKIINYSNALTEAERSTVTELLNGFEDLKERIQAHAKNVMILAQHDHETFGPTRDIGLHNFHEIVDYHKVLTNGVDGMQEEWVQQVSSYASRTDSTYIATEV